MSRTNVLRFFALLIGFTLGVGAIHYTIVSMPSYGFTGFTIGDGGSGRELGSFLFEPLFVFLLVLVSLILVVYFKRNKREVNYPRVITLSNLKRERIEVERD